MSTEETLKRTYLDNGGSESGFEAVKGELLAAHRKGKGDRGQCVPALPQLDTESS